MLNILQTYNYYYINYKITHNDLFYVYRTKIVIDLLISMTEHQQSENRICICVLCGIPGSGKSTLIKDVKKKKLEEKCALLGLDNDTLDPERLTLNENGFDVSTSASTTTKSKAKTREDRNVTNTRFIHFEYDRILTIPSHTSTNDICRDVQLEAEFSYDYNDEKVSFLKFSVNSGKTKD